MIIDDEKSLEENVTESNFNFDDTDDDKPLDQSQIDSLLEVEEIDEEPKEQGMQAVLKSSTIYYERLPMLEVVFDRLVRILSTSLRNFTSDNVEVSFEEITSQRFGDYLDAIPLPAMLSVFKAQQWDNQGLIVVDSSMIYSIVDVLLGGGRKGNSVLRIEGRPYTTIERNLVERMMALILTDLAKAFEPVSNVDFNFDRLETNPRFATITRSATIAIIVRLRVDMEDRGGIIEILLPYPTLEPIREVLLQNYMGEKFGSDAIWEDHLASKIKEADIHLNATIPREHSTLREILDWKVGDQIALESTPGSLVDLICEDQVVFSGRIGQKGGKIAIRIEESYLNENKDAIT